MSDPRIRLDPIGEDELDGFLEALLPDYVRARAEADHVSLPEAEAFARRQHAELLPQGAQTPGHRFLRIMDDASEAAVGTLWTFHDPASGEAYIYDITILPDLRRRGYGRAALERAADQARAAGCRRIALNVFAGNGAAQDLYRKLGYRMVSHHMNRMLR